MCASWNDILEWVETMKTQKSSYLSAMARGLRCGLVALVVLAVLGCAVGAGAGVRPYNKWIAPAGGTLPAGPVSIKATYSDDDGPANIKKAYVLINDSLAQNDAALLYYDHAANKVYLKNDANTSWGTGYAPGTAVVLENSQCKVYVDQTTVTVTSEAGVLFNVSWRIELKSPFSSKPINGYMYVQDYSGLSDGWDMMAVYHAVKPEVVDISPNIGALPIDTEITLVSSYKDINGWKDIKRCYVLVNDTLNIANAVFLMYDLVAGKVYLMNDENSWGTGYIAGADVTLSNSQCEFYVRDMTTVSYGSVLWVHWPIRLKNTMTGKLLSSWMYVLDWAALSDGWTKVGMYYVPALPVCVSVLPSFGSFALATPTTFTTEYGDDNGSSDIRCCYFQLSSTSSAADAILLKYDAPQNKVFLRNNANTSWGTGYTPGEQIKLVNGQCKLNVAQTAVTATGPDTLQIQWNLTVSANLAGLKLTERMYVDDDSLLKSGWKVKGYVTGQ